MIGIAGVFLVADDSASATSFSIEEEDLDYGKVNTSIKYVIEWTDAEGYKYEAKLYDSSGKAVSGGISNGTGTCTAANGSAVISVSENDAGSYKVKVVFTKGEGDEAVSQERSDSVKFVDPIKLTATISNTGDAERSFRVYFVVNGEKMDDSRQDVVVSANGTKEVSYEYITKNVSDGKFYLEADTTGLGGMIKGLGPDSTHNFYASANDYTWIEILAVVVVIILAILAIYIYRKPIRNYGKPKARR